MLNIDSDKRSHFEEWTHWPVGTSAGLTYRKVRLVPIKWGGIFFWLIYIAALSNESETKPRAGLGNYAHKNNFVIDMYVAPPNKRHTCRPKVVLISVRITSPILIPEQKRKAFTDYYKVGHTRAYRYH
jgi:hypothetical protein